MQSVFSYISKQKKNIMCCLNQCYEEQHLFRFVSLFIMIKMSYQ